MLDALGMGGGASERASSSRPAGYEPKSTRDVARDSAGAGFRARPDTRASQEAIGQLREVRANVKDVPPPNLAEDRRAFEAAMQELGRPLPGQATPIEAAVAAELQRYGRKLRSPPREIP
jgi:hypothetical protein